MNVSLATLLQFIYQANGHRSLFHLVVFFLWRPNSGEKTTEHRRARSMGINYHRVLSYTVSRPRLSSLCNAQVSTRLNRTKLNHSLKGDSRHECTSRLSEFDPRAFDPPYVMKRREIRLIRIERLSGHPRVDCITTWEYNVETARRHVVYGS